LATGGRLFVVVGDGQPQEALLVTRQADGGFVSTGLFETRVDALENAARPERFQF
jgi:protein-L-isoaspartate O-methyltransferase